MLALRQTARASSLPTVNRSALKPRSALRKPDFSFDFPPQRGVLTQKTQFDTEVTEASRRGTERCIGVNAIVGFTHRVNPNPPGPDPKVFLSELLFVLSGLCDKIEGVSGVSSHCVLSTNEGDFAEGDRQLTAAIAKSEN